MHICQHHTLKPPGVLHFIIADLRRLAAMPCTLLLSQHLICLNHCKAPGAKNFANGRISAHILRPC